MENMVRCGPRDEGRNRVIALADVLHGVQSAAVCPISILLRLRNPNYTGNPSFGYQGIEGGGKRGARRQRRPEKGRTDVTRLLDHGNRHPYRTWTLE
jgi:hypothetical protein